MRLWAGLAASLAVWVCSPAQALGLGNGPSAVVLGQPLDFVVPLRLEGDEAMPECLQAEVVVGDQRPLPTTVRVRGSGAAAALRVTSAAPVDEPIVTVQLSAGCVSKVQRRYVVFADPGTVAPSAPVVALPLVPTPAADASAPAGTEGAARGDPTAVPATGAATASPAPREVDRSRRARAEPSADRVRHRQGRRERPQRPRAAEAARRLANADAPREEARPRLRLEAPEPGPRATAAAEGPGDQIVEEAIRAVSLAASAARQAAEAASAQSARIASLEAEVQQLRGDRRANQGELERLRALLNRPQAQAWWLWPLVGLVLLLALAAAWLMWRLRGVQRTQEVAWARATAAAAAQAPDTPMRETSPLPLVHSVISAPAPLTPVPGSETAPAPHEITAAGLRTSVLEPATTQDTSMARTMPLAPGVLPREDKPRDVSIEELIDVDQQAEFFIALGQDHAAIDLLVAHLRDTGGGSPLTYLKLLEIYQRVGDSAAYERTRQRFNQRYNAYAPEWGADLAAGKTLEDYDAVLPRVVAAWPRPLDAMAELEALLFRKSRGELFELPAYRDVLFLYSMARDHMDHESGDPQLVDLLLPLDGQTQPGTAVGSSRATSDRPVDDHPTAPLDLDLTPPPRSRDSIFGELLQPSTQPNPRR